MARRLGGVPLTLLMMLALVGCTTSSNVVTSPIGSSHTGPISRDIAASKELAVASRMVRAGEHSLVIPRLERIAEDYADTDPGVEALYFLGVTYYQIDGLAEALRYFKEYIGKAPEGKYAALARDHASGLGEEIAEKYQTPEEREAQIAEAEEQAAMEPKELARQLGLADLYWQDGQYQKAGGVYQQILQQWPQLETDSVIRQRIERQPGGVYVILTPEEVEKRYEETDPLVIFNTASFRSGRFQGWPSTSSESTYNVSGQVVNRGSRPLQGVTVHVTIYGFGDLVYGTRAVGIGQLPPGQTRAFSTSFREFDDIENVHRYECVGSFQR